MAFPVWLVLWVIAMVGFGHAVVTGGDDTTAWLVATYVAFLGWRSDS